MTANTWDDAAADLDAALALIDAALDGRDWSGLAATAWEPPHVEGEPGVVAKGRLAGLAVRLAELREQVEAELAGLEAELAELAERRRAGRAYAAGDGIPA